MVSEKMKHKLSNLIYGWCGVPLETEVKAEIAQAVVNAAWTEFDADDESTWPDDIGDKNRPLWVMVCNVTDHVVWRSKKLTSPYWKDIGVTYWCDPKNLMYNGE